jgi:hypothetical protein
LYPRDASSSTTATTTTAAATTTTNEHGHSNNTAKEVGRRRDCTRICGRFSCEQSSCANRIDRVDPAHEFCEV